LCPAQQDSIPARNLRNSPPALPPLQGKSPTARRPAFFASNSLPLYSLLKSLLKTIANPGTPVRHQCKRCHTPLNSHSTIRAGGIDHSSGLRANSRKAKLSAGQKARHLNQFGGYGYNGLIQPLIDILQRERSCRRPVASTWSMPSFSTHYTVTLYSKIRCFGSHSSVLAGDTIVESARQPIRALRRSLHIHGLYGGGSAFATHTDRSIQRFTAIRIGNHNSRYRPLDWSRRCCRGRRCSMLY